jgi:hypothetical protein
LTAQQRKRSSRSDSADAYVARLSADRWALEMSHLIARNMADAVGDLALDAGGGKPALSNPVQLVQPIAELVPTRER